MRRPLGNAIWFRSVSICITMAVEVRTKPVPATKLATAGYPKAKPTQTRAAIASAT